MLKRLLVKTDGEAYLRNGYVNLTAIGAELGQFDGTGAAIMGFSTRGAKSAENGVGYEANGYFWIPTVALVALAKKIIHETMGDEDQIVVTMEDGIVVDTRLPEWLQGMDVQFVDLDSRAIGQCPSCGELGYDGEAEYCEACGFTLMDEEE